jgi:DnaA family protein
MTEQLALDLVHSLRYSSSEFLVHAGVSEVIETVMTLLVKRSFSITYIQGEKGCGKTHLAVHLAGRYQERKGWARLVMGGSFVKWFSEELPKLAIRPWELVIVDDADSCLSDEDCHGMLVDLVERVARQKGSLVLLGATNPQSIATSPQLVSRLNAGLHLLMGDTREEDLNSLLECITKQRGLQLTPTKRAYVLKRVKRNIPALVECIESLERQPGAVNTFRIHPTRVVLEKDHSH